MRGAGWYDAAAVAAGSVARAVAGREAQCAVDQRLADHHEADEQARRCRPGEEGGRERRPGREQQHEGGDAGQQPARGHVPQRPDEEGGARQHRRTTPQQQGVGTGGHGRHPPIRAGGRHATPDRGLAISRRSRGRHRAARQPRLAPEKQSPTMRLSRSASMTLSPVRPDGTRALLPMAGHTHGNRSAVTCHLRCGDACFQRRSQHHRHGYFRDVAATGPVPAYGPRRHGRRRRDRGVRPVPSPEAPQQRPALPRRAAPRHRDRAACPSPPIAPVASTVDDVTVPVGYRWDPIIRWGDPITRKRAGVRRGQPGPRGTGAAVRLQLRLPRHHRDRPQGHARPAGGQPRVHQRGHHVPADHVGGGGRPHRVGRPRHVGRGAAPPARRRDVGATTRAVGSTAGSPWTPSSPSTARPPGPTCSRPPQDPLRHAACAAR